jgi:hypothetical protein
MDKIFPESVKFFTELNNLVVGINISLRVIELLKKNGSYSAIFKRVEGKLLFLKTNLETGRQSYRKIALQKKKNQFGAKTSCSEEYICGRRMVPIQLF